MKKKSLESKNTVSVESIVSRSLIVSRHSSCRSCACLILMLNMKIISHSKSNPSNLLVLHNQQEFRSIRISPFHVRLFANVDLDIHSQVFVYTHEDQH